MQKSWNFQGLVLFYLGENNEHVWLSDLILLSLHGKDRNTIITIQQRNMDLLEQIVARAKADKQRIVLPEAE
ncbi:MAG: hypothetical protein ACFNWT_08525, partial [Prevotella denticola]